MKVPRRFLVVTALAVATIGPSLSYPSGAEGIAGSQPGNAIVVPAIAQADHRCFFGTGIQVWQDAYKGGPTAIFCGTHIGSLSGTSPYDDLSRLAEQLTWYANWNDRISSFEIFNTGDGGTHLIHFCTDTGGHGTCTGSYSTSVYVGYVGDSFNDKITSIYDVGGN